MRLNYGDYCSSSAKFFSHTTSQNSRRFLLIVLLIVFLVYCAHTSSTCNGSGRVFDVDDQQREKHLQPSIIHSTADDDDDSDSSSDDDLNLIIRNATNGQAGSPHRTRTCANELNHYSSSNGAEDLHSSSNRRRLLPSALIIGVKKSGTRALLEFIRFHPDVRASGCEVHFFDRHYNKGLRWYRHRMPATNRDGQITMEKTPSYFITREVPKRVYNMNPKTKLLLVVRDPVTRAISDYTQAITKLTTTRKFEELAFVNGSKGVVNTKWGPLRIGLYCRHLHRWLQYFPLSQFLFISGERLIRDPVYELQRVEDFLHLKPLITEHDFYFNTTKGFPCILRKSRPHCLGKTKGRSHPAIDAVALNRLRQFYRPFNRKFYEMTGMDFGWP